MQGNLNIKVHQHRSITLSTAEMAQKFLNEHRVGDDGIK
jgi:hypothetical protein